MNSDDDVDHGVRLAWERLNPIASRLRHVMADEKPPSLKSIRQIASLVGLRPRQLTFWIYALAENKRYVSFEIPKRGGGTRTIDAPIKPLKDIQTRLAKALKSAYQPRAAVHGYVDGKSILTNARAHLRQRWVLRVDLTDFFPSINFGRVRGLFLAKPFDYPEDVATTLAQICCHNNKLPHGAPTSPIVSNLICRGMDRALTHLARKHRCHYTRYSDDLVFSTDRLVMPDALASRSGGAAVLGEALVDVIRDNGFTPNESKTKLVDRSQRLLVTGIVVNKRMSVPKRQIRSLRSLMHIWKSHGKQAATEAFQRAHFPSYRAPGKPLPAFELIIRGKIQHLGSVRGWEDPRYLSLANKLAREDPSFKPRVPLFGAGSSLRVFCEGETDALHFGAAKAYFDSRGEFPQLDVAFIPEREKGGDSRLFQAMESTVRVGTERPTLFLFDRDNPRMVRKVSEGDEVKVWADYVYSLAILIPDHRSNYSEVCVELLYDNEVLERRDDHGRRVYRREEFHETTGRHEDGHAYRVMPAKTLICEHVYSVTDETGSSLAISKMKFAERIARGEPPYEEVSFEGFRRTFEAICSIGSLLPPQSQAGPKK